MNNSICVKIKKINRAEDKVGKMPQYATAGAAAADLYACLDRDIVLKPGERAGIPTGIAIELPGPQIAALIFARSGLASKKGLALSNGVGVIDSDYRGEIVVLVVNLGREEARIQDGDRIAQIMFTPVYQACFQEEESLGETDRGAGGFGSTGLK